jgi:hypothetical protein
MSYIVTIFYFSYLIIILLLSFYIISFYLYLSKIDPKKRDFLLGDDMTGFFTRYRAPIRTIKYFFSETDEDKKSYRYYKKRIRILTISIPAIIVAFLMIIGIAAIIQTLS